MHRSWQRAPKEIDPCRWHRQVFSDIDVFSEVIFGAHRSQIFQQARLARQRRLLLAGTASLVVPFSIAPLRGQPVGAARDQEITDLRRRCEV